MWQVHMDKREANYTVPVKYVERIHDHYGFEGIAYKPLEVKMCSGYGAFTQL